MYPYIYSHARWELPYVIQVSFIVSLDIHVTFVECNWLSLFADTLSLSMAFPETFVDPLSLSVAFPETFVVPLSLSVAFPETFMDLLSLSVAFPDAFVDPCHCLWHTLKPLLSMTFPETLVVYGNTWNPCCLWHSLKPLLSMVLPEILVVYGIPWNPCCLWYSLMPSWTLVTVCGIFWNPCCLWYYLKPLLSTVLPETLVVYGITSNPCCQLYYLKPRVGCRIWFSCSSSVCTISWVCMLTRAARSRDRHMHLAKDRRSYHYYCCFIFNIQLSAKVISRWNTNHPTKGMSLGLKTHNTLCSMKIGKNTATEWSQKGGISWQQAKHAKLYSDLLQTYCETN